MKQHTYIKRYLIFSRFARILLHKVKNENFHRKGHKRHRWPVDTETGHDTCIAHPSQREESESSNI